MVRFIFIFLLLTFTNSLTAMQQIQGSINRNDALIAGDIEFLDYQEKFTNAQNKCPTFSFPKSQYIIDPILIKFKDTNQKWQTVLARGVLNLQSYNRNTGVFEFKLTMDNFVQSQIFMPWNRSKTDTPLKGKIVFDIGGSDSTIVKGQYNDLTHEIIPLKSASSIFIVRHLANTGIQLGTVAEKDVPVTISLNS